MTFSTSYSRDNLLIQHFSCSNHCQPWAKSLSLVINSEIQVLWSVFSRKLDIPDVNWTSQMLDKKLLVTSPNWPRSDLQPFLKGSVWQSPGCPIRLIRPLWRVDGQTWTAVRSLLDLWCFMFSFNIGVRFSSNHLHLQEYKIIQDIFVNRGLWSCPKLLSGHAFRRPRFYLPSNTGVGHPESDQK